MMQLTESDLHFVLSRCPKDIRNKMKEHAGRLILAGGFIRSVITGENVSDVDLFANDKDFLLQIAKDFALERKGRYFSTKNAHTVLAPPRFPIQLITRWVFDNPQDCIASFDFTVCQAAIWAENGDSKYYFNSAISDNFYSDLAAHRLVYTYPARQEDVGGSLLRAIKFIKRGYNIQAPSLAGVISRIFASIEKEKIEDEKWGARVITGLLREVDPLTVVDGVDFIDEHQLIIQKEEVKE